MPRIEAAVQAISDETNFSVDEVKAWLNPLFDESEEHRDKVSACIEVLTSNYWGKAQATISKEGQLIDIHIPEGMKSNQIRALRSKRKWNWGLFKRG